jgi:hypothetical protein
LFNIGCFSNKLGIFLLIAFCGVMAEVKTADSNQRYHKWLTQIPRELNLTEYLCVVVLSEQCDYVFQKGELKAKYIVSTGSRDRFKQDRTIREGIWRLGERIKDNLPELYGPRLIYLEAYNPLRKNFVKTVKAFHGTNEPQNLGKPTSMGCVYHSNRDIIELYDLVPDKTLVLTVGK